MQKPANFLSNVSRVLRNAAKLRQTEHLFFEIENPKVRVGKIAEDCAEEMSDELTVLTNMFIAYEYWVIKPP